MKIKKGSIMSATMAIVLVSALTIGVLVVSATADSAGSAAVNNEESAVNSIVDDQTHDGKDFIGEDIDNGSDHKTEASSNEGEIPVVTDRPIDGTQADDITDYQYSVVRWTGPRVGDITGYQYTIARWTGPRAVDITDRPIDGTTQESAASDLAYIIDVFKNENGEFTFKTYNEEVLEQTLSDIDSGITQPSFVLGEVQGDAEILVSTVDGVHIDISATGDPANPSSDSIPE